MLGSQTHHIKGQATHGSGITDEMMHDSPDFVPASQINTSRTQSYFLMQPVQMSNAKNDQTPIKVGNMLPNGHLSFGPNSKA